MTTKLNLSHDPDEEPDHVKKYFWAYWGVWLFFGLLVAILAISMPELRYWILGAAAALIAVVLRAPGAEYRAFVQVVGLPAINTWSGPVPLVPGLMILHKIRKYPPQWQFPADPEHVFNGDDKEHLPIHPDGKPMVRPLRLVTGKARPESEYNHPTLNVQMTTKATGTMRPHIRNPIDFWVRHHGNTAEEKIEEARKQLNDTWLKAVQTEWGSRPAGMIIDEDAEIREAVQNAVDKDARHRGIDVFNMTVLHPDLSHDVSKAMAGIPEAQANKIRAETDADAKKYVDIRDGEAEAQVKLDRENAETDGTAYRVEKLGMEAGELIALEAATDIVGDKTQFIFGAGGVAEALGSGMAVLDKFRKGRSADHPDARGE